MNTQGKNQTKPQEKVSVVYKKQELTWESYWAIDSVQYSKAERTIIMVLKIILAILALPFLCFAVMACLAPEGSKKAESPTPKDDSFSDFSMSNKGFD